MPISGQYRPSVLIVEDEPLIRMSVVDFVEEAGFTAVEAANADEAIAELDQSDVIVILFTDIDMPGSMDGLALAETVRQKWPEVRIILASGHRKIAHHELPHGALFFSKPYDIEKIAGVMRRMTDRLN